MPTTMLNGKHNIDTTEDSVAKRKRRGRNNNGIVPHIDMLPTIQWDVERKQLNYLFSSRRLGYKSTYRILPAHLLSISLCPVCVCVGPVHCTEFCVCECVCECRRRRRIRAISVGVYLCLCFVQFHSIRLLEFSLVSSIYQNRLESKCCTVVVVYTV